ncbi:MAG: hypothetical protein JWM05_197 [Acidimicrobiales bacterium]|nr:hypothetical protein [Acidimicrobiales bacterium]
MRGADGRFFFLHMMKTGGTTFISQIQANFAPEEVYPPADLEPAKRLAAYVFVEPLRTLSPERLAAVRLFCGHYPFFATTLVGPVTTLTMLRDPVDRTISHLRHIKRGPVVSGVSPTQRYRDMSLAEIYDDPDRYNGFIHNFQAKLFAVGPDDGFSDLRHVLDVDAGRLSIAKENLEQIDVLGLSERHGDFVAEVRRRFGWAVDDIANQQVSTEEWEVSPELRARIQEDNVADMELYSHAVALCDRRRRESDTGRAATTTTASPGRR